MISIVLANYNGAKYLEETIVSVINQDIDDYEFIIVDDGSTDNSRVIIDKYLRHYPNIIRPIYQPDNKGQGEAINIGISLAKGELICLLDSDDVWLPNKLRYVKKCFENNKYTVIFQHRMVFIQDGKLTTEKLRIALYIGDYFSFVKKNNIFPEFMPTSGLAFPRWVLEKVLPIPIEFRTCADGYLTRTCFCYGDVEATSEVLGAYRIHGNNNVYSNSNFNMDQYINELLIPSLNNFYTNKDIPFKFSKERTISLLNRFSIVFRY